MDEASKHWKDISHAILPPWYRKIQLWIVDHPKISYTILITIAVASWLAAGLIIGATWNV